MALAILDGIETGQEDIFPDPFAVDWPTVRVSLKASERQVAARGARAGDLLLGLPGSKLREGGAVHDRRRYGSENGRLRRGSDRTWDGGNER